MTMHVFDEALRRTLFHEGGYSDNPHDSGGATKFGVSLRFLRSIGQDIDGDGDVDQDDIRALTGDQARDLYFEHFWNAASCGRIYSTALQIKLFDTAVNMGVRRAVRLLQASYNSSFGNSSAPLGVDGVLGPLSVAAINGSVVEDSTMMKSYRFLQKEAYWSIIKLQPKNKVFWVGWQRRAAT
jgi:lysozyme family protein